MLFLTDPDPRDIIKGSRDPLGFVPLWSHFGRHVVGNLTTATTSLRGFTTLILGLYLAKRAQEKYGTDAGSTVDLFIRWEQIASYCRYHHANDGSFRGVDRVRKRLADNNDRVSISNNSNDLTLADQKVYGLWGLFSVASRESGLLRTEEPSLTDAADEHIQKILLPRMFNEGLPNERALIELLRLPRFTLQLNGQHKAVTKAIAAVLSKKLTAPERTFYRFHLLYGGGEKNDETKGLQTQLVNIFETVNWKTEFKRDIFRKVKKIAKSNEQLADRLERIDLLEGLLAPAENAFMFLLSRRNSTVAEVAKELQEKWEHLDFVAAADIRTLRSEIAVVYDDTLAADRLLSLSDALAGGDYKTAVTLLLQHNAFVMENRGSGAAWVREAAGKLDVRFLDDNARLREKDDLAHSWDNTYFLNALHGMTNEVTKV